MKPNRIGVSRLRRAAIACSSLAAVAMAGTSAHAAVYALSPSTLSSSFTSTSPLVSETNATALSQTFTDDFTFSVVGSVQSFFSAAFIESAASGYVINDADLMLFAGMPGVGTPTLLGNTGLFNPITTASPTLTDLLVPGAYFVQAQVTTPPSDTASYSIIATAKAVSAAPEPAAWILLMAGVGLTGFAMRRARERQTVAAT